MAVRPSGLLVEGEEDSDFGAHVFLAFQDDAAFHHLGDVPHDGKAQAGAARFLGTALIHPVEAFKYPLLVFGRDADAGR